MKRRAIGERLAALEREASGAGDGYLVWRPADDDPARYTSAAYPGERLTYEELHARTHPPGVLHIIVLRYEETTSASL